MEKMVRGELPTLNDYSWLLTIEQIRASNLSKIFKRKYWNLDLEKSFKCFKIDKRQNLKNLISKSKFSKNEPILRKFKLPDTN